MLPQRQLPGRQERRTGAGHSLTAYEMTTVVLKQGDRVVYRGSMGEYRGRKATVQFVANKAGGVFINIDDDPYIGWVVRRSDVEPVTDPFPSRQWRRDVWPADQDRSRIASVPRDQFEAMVESGLPATYGGC
jgi:hypothetical protein